DLRHSAATLLLLAQGLHPRVLMEQLGHSKIATTMDIYAHVMPAPMLEDVASKMEAALNVQIRLSFFSHARAVRLGVFQGWWLSNMAVKVPKFDMNDERTLDFTGGQGVNRTLDTRIFSPLLYRLSYLPTVTAVQFADDACSERSFVS